ncbi:MAG: hypothetical protein ACNA8L_06385 [Luteolibacter sp.]
MPVFRIIERIVIWTTSITVMLAASTFALAATGMWVLEPWLRPLIFLHLDERWLLTAATFGWAAAAIACPGNRRKSWWWRAVATGVLCMSGLIAASIPAREVAMRMLKRSLPVHSAFKDDAPKWREHDAWTKHFNERWFYFEKDLPEWVQIGENSIGAYSTSTQYRPEFTPFDHLLETSRWPFRKFFIMEVMRHESAVELATRDWHRLFPAIVGQDVTLARRNELIGMLHERSNDASAAPASRDAASFWMGLIVLTDAPEFERWRLPALDAMLASGNPPMSLTGDVWMRVIDALLAFDADPGASVERFANHRTLLRRAVRERVRGMEAHIPAIIDAIVTLDGTNRPYDALALWMDLKQMLDRNPDAPNHQITRTWMRERMFQWLMDDTEVFKWRFFTKYRVWAIDVEDLLVDFAETESEALTARVLELIASTNPNARTEHKKHGAHHVLTSAIIQAIFIRNFVDDERRAILSQMIGTFIAQHLAESTNWEHYDWKSDSHAIREMIGELTAFWQDLDEELRSGVVKQLRQSLTETNHKRIQTPGRNINGQRPALPLHLLAFFDASLEQRIFTETEHLALLACANQGNHGAASTWALRSAIEPLRFSADTVYAFIHTLATALDQDDSMVSFSREPDAVRFPVAWFRTWLGNPRRFSLTMEDAIRIRLMNRRIVGIEHLPADWPSTFHACPEARRMAGNHDAPEIWQPLMDSPAAARKTLEVLSDESALILIGLFSHLMRHPPDSEVKSVIWNHYREMAETGSPAQRRTAWHVLLKTSTWMSPKDRAETRKRFAEFFLRERPSLSDWSHALMLNMDSQSYPWSAFVLMDETHRGEWVDWEEDALSARLSWSSQIHHECALLEHRWNIESNDGLFTHLVNASDACANSFGIHFDIRELHDPHPSRFWRNPPPQIPFPPTPWQRARELRFKHPNLHFPDRPAFRPAIVSFSEKR